MMIGLPKQLRRVNWRFVHPSVPVVAPAAAGRHAGGRTFLCAANLNARRRLLLCSSLAVADSVPMRMLLESWMKEHTRGPALYVPTAYKLRADSGPRTIAVRSSLEAALNVKVETLDLDHYAAAATLTSGSAPVPDEAAAAELDARLGEASMLIVSGGNTFYLQAAVLASGFSTVAQKHLRGGMPFVGQSAGSIIMGKTIATAFWKGWDDPGAVPHLDFEREPELSRGLDVLEGRSIFPHYVHEEHSELVARRRKELPSPGRLESIAEHEALVFSCEGSRCQMTTLYGHPGRVGNSIFAWENGVAAAGMGTASPATAE